MAGARKNGRGVVGFTGCAARRDVAVEITTDGGEVGRGVSGVDGRGWQFEWAMRTRLERLLLREFMGFDWIYLGNWVEKLISRLFTAYHDGRGGLNLVARGGALMRCCLHRIEYGVFGQTCHDGIGLVVCCLSIQNLMERCIATFIIFIGVTCNKYGT